MAAVKFHARKVVRGPVPVQQLWPTVLSSAALSSLMVVVVDRLPALGNFVEKWAYWQGYPLYTNLQLLEYGVSDFVKRNYRC